MTIKELSLILKEISGFKGEIIFNHNMPDGIKRKMLDVSLAKDLNWSSIYNFKEMLKFTYNWYLEIGSKNYY